jgi:plasmid maintenance system antidote protein VapI
MLGNMITELRRKNITNKAVAELIGSTEKTVVNKLNGTSEFTVSEAMSINVNLLPEYRLSYLCTPTDTPRTA